MLIIGSILFSFKQGGANIGKIRAKFTQVERRKQER